MPLPPDPTDPPPILDVTRGEQLKERGMATAEAHADDAWKDAAYLAVCAVAQRCHRFTTDAVWVALGVTDPPREPRALGPVMRRAMRDQIIVPTSEFDLTARPSRHRAPLRVWQSHILGERAPR